MDWKKYKGEGPWKFSKGSGHYSYNEGNLISTSDNPVFSVDHSGIPITDIHRPCGYWFDSPAPAPTTAAEFIDPVDNIVGAGLGLDTSYAPVAAWYLYDADTNSWERKTDYPGGGMDQATACKVNGKIYVGLGERAGSHLQTSDWYEYDIASDTWTKKADYPGALTTGSIVTRSIRPESIVVDGKCYIAAGGYVYFDAHFHLTHYTSTKFWCYDPELDQWSELANLDSQSIVPGSTCLESWNSSLSMSLDAAVRIAHIESTIYLYVSCSGVSTDGHAPTTRLYTYNIPANAWTIDCSWNPYTGGSYPGGHWEGNVYFDIEIWGSGNIATGDLANKDGQLYLLQWHYIDSSHSILRTKRMNSVSSYTDLADYGTFIDRPQARFSHANDKLYAMVGQNNDGLFWKQYDIAGDSWTSKANPTFGYYARGPTISW